MARMRRSRAGPSRCTGSTTRSCSSLWPWRCCCRCSAVPRTTAPVGPTPPTTQVQLVQNTHTQTHTHTHTYMHTHTHTHMHTHTHTHTHARARTHTRFRKDGGVSGM